MRCKFKLNLKSQGIFRAGYLCRLKDKTYTIHYVIYARLINNVKQLCKKQYFLPPYTTLGLRHGWIIPLVSLLRSNTKRNLYFLALGLEGKTLPDYCG